MKTKTGKKVISIILFASIFSMVCISYACSQTKHAENRNKSYEEILKTPVLDPFQKNQSYLSNYQNYLTQNSIYKISLKKI